MSANQKVNLLPGDYLFREGEFGQTAYLIDEGTIELVKLREINKPFLLN